MVYYVDREKLNKVRELRNNMTLAEIILWSRLRSRKINGYKFRRQQPILRYIVDFYCHELKLVVEVDGEIHSENIEYDTKRDKLLNINGYHVLRLTNIEVITELNSAVDKINSFISEILSPSRGTIGGKNDRK